MFALLLLACLHDQNKSGFLEGRPFFSQSELFENFFDCTGWLSKSRSSKKPLLFWSCKQAIYVYLYTFARLFYPVGFFFLLKSTKKLQYAKATIVF